MARSDEIVRLIDAANRRARPVELDGDRGRITPGKLSAALTVVGSVALALAILLASGDSAEWSLRALAGLLLLPGLFMLPSLTTRHDVTWDAQGVSGARRMFGPTLGWARTTIAWPQISSAGRTFTGYWYIQAVDGRRVYWSYLYPGYPVFLRRLARTCPRLDLRAIEDCGD